MQRKAVQRTENRPFSRSATCPHITRFKDESMLNSYTLLYACYVAGIYKESFKKKISNCICKITWCRTKRKRIHACLSCIYFGCHFSHIQSHAAEHKHPLSMDVDFGQVYCAVCSDYKYDADFLKIAQHQNKIRQKQDSCRKRNNRQNDKIISKPYRWEPSLQEIELLKKHDVVNHSRIGIRGLININKFTCFLSSPIQCVIQAPVFRDYLLSCEHRCKSEEDQCPSCFICEMSGVLQEGFSGDKEPFALARLLCLLCKRVPQLVDGQMQDALECLIHLLDNFHEDEIKTYKKNPQAKPCDPCNCISHSVFHFQFRRQRTCNNKQSPHVTNLDEQGRWNIDFYQLPESAQKLEVRLNDCLEKSLYEHIDEYFCPQCQGVVGYTLQLIPKKLPYVMIFCTHNSNMKKSGAFMSFEQHLDMSRYMKRPDGTPEYMYYLFGVIEHLPAGNGGHYRSYVRKDNRWFSCDDRETWLVSWDDVSEIKPKILFYHRIYV